MSSYVVKIQVLNESLFWFISGRYSTVLAITIIDIVFQYFISYITLQQMPLHQDLLKMLYCAPVCTYQIVIGKAHVSMHLHVKSVWLKPHIL